MKVLLSAFACEPNTGSEPYVGWSWAELLSTQHEIHVFTREYSRKEIENSKSDINATFHYFDLPGCSSKDHYWSFIRPYYVIWQFFVLFKVITLHAQYRFSVIHHITYNNIDVPGFLWLIRGPRFVWGAVGGGQIPPKSLNSVFSIKNRIKRNVRAIIKYFVKVNPVVILAVKKAHMVFYANEETESLLRHIKHNKTKMLETAMHQHACLPSSCLLGVLEKREDLIKEKKRLNIIWVGRVEESKGLVIALDALNSISDKLSFNLDVVGDGECLDRIKKYTSKLKISKNIKFHGRVPYSEVKQMMRESSLFLFTSIQDTSGNVVLESMSQAVPVVGFNFQGMKEISGGRGGVLINVGSYASAISDFGDAILSIYNNEKLRYSLSVDAYQNIIDNHLWRNRFEKVNSTYQSPQRND